MSWCVLAWRVDFGPIEVHGPYDLRADAATAAVMLSANTAYDEAYVYELIKPKEN